jgi:thiol-disulfide isomerase/thioredoxin
MTKLAKPFAAGLTFGEFVAGARVHRAAFLEHYDRLAGIVPQPAGKGHVDFPRALLIAEDWCPDCVFNIPILARLSEAADPARVRIVRRPEHEELAERFPGRGGVSRIPTVVFLDECDDVVDYWAERCPLSQRWFDEFTRAHPLPRLEFQDGIPAPPLMEWMQLRISRELAWFYGGAWRDVLAEIAAIVGAARAKAAGECA